MTVNPTAFRDAERTNDSDRNAQIFKDINLSFMQNIQSLVTLQVFSNVEAVKRSVRNLINTNFYERPFHPEIGSNVRSVLFEPVSPVVAAVLERHVKDVIENFEPRAELIDVVVSDNADANEYRVQIKFFIVNSSDIVDMNIFLERLR